MLARAAIFISVLVTVMQVTTLASLAAKWSAQRDAGLGFDFNRALPGTRGRWQAFLPLFRGTKLGCEVPGRRLE
jgi:hypothetical protein